MPNQTPEELLRELCEVDPGHFRKSKTHQFWEMNLRHESSIWFPMIPDALVEDWLYAGWMLDCLWHEGANPKLLCFDNCKDERLPKKGAMVHTLIGSYPAETPQLAIIQAFISWKKSQKEGG